MRKPLRQALAEFFSQPNPSPRVLMANDSVIEWRSRYRPIQFRFGPPWGWATVPHDVESKTLIAVIDDNDGSHFVINVDDQVRDANFDVEAEDLKNKLHMLNANPRNRLIAEQDVKCHGSVYRFLRFETFSDKWGRSCVDALTRRTETLFIAIQMHFPFEGDRVDNRPPEKILTLNRDLRVYE